MAAFRISALGASTLAAALTLGGCASVPGKEAQGSVDDAVRAISAGPQTQVRVTNESYVAATPVEYVNLGEGNKHASSEWLLAKGDSVSRGLKRWADQVSWVVVWDYQQDWVVPNDAYFVGDFVSAVNQVIQSLRNSGASIRATFYSPNRTVVISK